MRIVAMMRNNLKRFAKIGVVTPVAERARTPETPRMRDAYRDQFFFQPDVANKALRLVTLRLPNFRLDRKSRSGNQCADQIILISCIEGLQQLGFGKRTSSTVGPSGSTRTKQHQDKEDIAPLV